VRLILSIRIIASFTTIQVSAMNHIPKVILYGFQVTYNHIFTHKSASITEYKTMIGCLNELNWKTKIENIRNNEINKERIVERISSLFSDCSHPALKLIPSGKLYCSAKSSSNGCTCVGITQLSNFAHTEIVIFPSSLPIDDTDFVNL